MGKDKDDARRGSMGSAGVFGNSQSLQAKAQLVPRRKVLLLRVLESVSFQLFIIALVLCDIALFFLELDSSTRNAIGSDALVITQTVIAGVFVLEITAKLHVYGLRRFTTVTSNVVDTFIVVVTTIGSVFQLIEYLQGNEDNSGLSGITDLSQGSTVVRLVRIFRLFRLFRMYRLYEALKLIPTQKTTSRTLTPNAQVMEILYRTKQCLLTSGEFDDYVKPSEIQWVLDVVKENRLGVAVLQHPESVDMAYMYQMGIVVSPNADPSGAGGAGGDKQGKPRGSTRLSLIPNTNRVKSESILCGVPDTKSVNRMLQDHAESWDFDIFALDAMTANQPLKAVGYHVFHELGLCEHFKIEDTVLVRWLDLMESGYPKTNPYHNRVHVADVTQTLFSLLKMFDMLDDFLPVHVFATIVAAVMHDYKHVGFSNNFLVTSRDDLALRYNDKSVLESHSLAVGFADTLANDDANIFKTLPHEMFLQARSFVVQLVLHTDMAFHFDLLGKIEAKEQVGFDLRNVKDAQLVMGLFLHLADISNPIKPLDIAAAWSKVVMQEFRRQGGVEKQRGMKVSLYMDPDGGAEMEDQCQFAFIDLFVEPLLLVFAKFIEGKKPHCVEWAQGLTEMLADNKASHQPHVKKRASTRLAPRKKQKGEAGQGEGGIPEDKLL